MSGSVEQLGEVAEIARAMWRRAMASDVVDHELADWSQRLYALAVDQAERDALPDWARDR